MLQPLWDFLDNATFEHWVILLQGVLLLLAVLRIWLLQGRLAETIRYGRSTPKGTEPPVIYSGMWPGPVREVTYEAWKPEDSR